MAWSDWAKAARSYAGWVPNVGSHLSFSLIGANSSSMVARRTCDHRELDGSVGRMVCLVDKRQTDDFLWPPEIMRRLVPSVVQHFALVGITEPVLVPTGFVDDEARDENGFQVGKQVKTDSDEQGALVGRVHLLPDYQDRKQSLTQRWLLEEIANVLARPSPNSKAEQTGLLDEVESLVRWRSPAAIAVEFALMRTGEIRLWYANDYDDLEESDYILAAKQAYFFIKDMAHRHLHHDPASDQITPLVRFEVVEAKPEQADTDWRRRTLWNLAREAERQGKLPRLDKQRQALGILAFADAFQKTLLPYRRDPNEPSNFCPNDSVYGYDFNFIRESTKLRVDHMAAQRSAIAPMLSAMVAGAIAALALVSSLVSTHNSALRQVSEGAAQNSAASGPVAPPPLQLGIHETVMTFLAAYPVAAAIFAMGVLGILYRIALDDILGGTWKPWQRLRGLSVSLTIALGSRSSRVAHRILESLYATVLVIELVGVYFVFRQILTLTP